jgi:hypothetical protein
MNQRPQQGEYNDFFQNYINHAPDGNIEEILAAQFGETTQLLLSLTEDQADLRYAPGKWTLKEVIGHISDNERIMAYRLLRISRGDATPLPGYDQDELMKAAPFQSWTLDRLIEDYTAVRRATLTLLDGLPQEAWTRMGTANNSPLSARALAYIIAGHELHHLLVIKEKYLG